MTDTPENVWLIVSGNAIGVGEGSEVAVGSGVLVEVGIGDAVPVGTRIGVGGCAAG